MGGILLTANAELLKKTGVITFLDILGWKGIYVRKSDPISTLNSLIVGIRNEVPNLRGKNGIYYDVNLKKNNIDITSISDTIVLYTQCHEEEAPLVIDLHGVLCQWIIPKSIYLEIPVRGAISFGEYENDSSVFVGKAVDEAAAWHEQADWIGVHLTPSAEYLFDVNLMNNLWIEYDLPTTKSQLKWRPHCVNWTVTWKDRENEIRNIKTKFRQLGPISPDIAGKFINTVKFLEEATKKKAKVRKT